MNRRVERVQSLIRHELGELIQQDLNDPRITGLVSITEVEVTPDLRRARIFFSVYGTEEDGKSAMDAFISAQPYLRRELGKRLDLRYAPQLEFRLDRSMEYAEQMNKLFQNIHVPASREGQG